MLQNWQDLEEWDKQIRSRWGTRAEGALSLEEIQKEAEDNGPKWTQWLAPYLGQLLSSPALRHTEVPAPLGD